LSLPKIILLGLALVSFSQPPVQGQKRVIDTYAFEHDVTIYGKDERGGVGMCQFTTGDVNGDGKQDLVFGVQGSGPDGNKQWCGEIDIFLGGNPLPAIVELQTYSPDVRIYGKDTDDRLGALVAVGDVNGDGVDDIVAAAPYGDGRGNLRSDCGEVYVIFGRSNFPSEIDLSMTNPDVVIFGPDSNDHCGRLCVGDLNNDGIKDVVISIYLSAGYGNSRTGSGEAHVIFGGSFPSEIDLATGASDVVFYGADPGDNFGRTIAIGDYNGDHINDVAWSAPLAHGPSNATGQGEIYLMYGPLALGIHDFQSAMPDLIIYAPSTGAIGVPMAFGDVNDDGIQDLIFSEWIPAGGGLFSIFGRSDLPAVINLMDAGVMPDFIVTGGAGGAVACSDINGDGKDDIIIGLPDIKREKEPAANSAGEGYALYGGCARPTGVNLGFQQADITILGSDENDQMGYQMAVGDVNSDGINDIILGVSGGDGRDNLGPDHCGEIYIVSGVRTLPIKFDLLKSAWDPANLLPYKLDVPSPKDDSPSILSDGNLYFYRLQETNSPKATIAANKQHHDGTVRISWLDIQRCSEIPPNPVNTVISAYPGCVLADGQMPAYVEVVPRDEFGDILGTGLSVSVDPNQIFPGFFPAEIVDLFNGAYVQEIRSFVSGEAKILVSVEGYHLPLSPQKIVFVNRLPGASFTCNDPTPFGQPTNFTSTVSGGTGPYTYAWDFENDGNIDSTDPNPSYTYPQPGRYTVTLVVIDAKGCDTYFFREVTVV
jgi:hypothetical protein